MVDSWTFFEGSWHSGNPKIIGPMTQAMWLASSVFDGARAFEGTTPDLDKHCARSVTSAEALGLVAPLTADEVTQIAFEAVSKFSNSDELYIRPMFWAASGGAVPDPDSTQFALCTYVEKLPDPIGFSATLTDYHRPNPNSMVTGAKASCLYPALGRPLARARQNGFDTMVVLDQEDNIAEFATANLFMVSDGVVYTPQPNESYLNGITRQRVIGLLRNDGITVVETVLCYSDIENAQEVFSTGNHAKIVPMTRLGSKPYSIGPVYSRARELYWDFAHTNEGLHKCC